jgi:hypothetical protein
MCCQARRDPLRIAFFGEQVRSVPRNPRGGAFIHVEMQFQPIVGGYAREHIVKQYSLSVAFISHVNSILILDSEFIRIAQAHMDTA